MKRIVLLCIHGGASYYPGRVGGHVIQLATDEQLHPGTMSQYHLFPREY